MIHLSDPKVALDRALLHAKGGFAWWYLDLLTPEGDGLVLIWSFGLPFLPGYASAARAGEAPEAGQRPSLNLAIYEGGEQVFYLLQELPPEQASWAPGTERCVFGDSTLHSAREGERRVLEVDLDIPVPGSEGRLRGRIRAEGPAVTPPPGLRGFGHADTSHAWSPLLTAATGEARLEIEGRERALRGRVYHDRNGSALPLHGLGIEHWLWGRCPFEDRERIYYVVWPEGGGAPQALGLEVSPDGLLSEVPELEVQLGTPRRALYGMPWWREISLRSGEAPWLEIEARRCVDNGPFYLRHLNRCRDASGAEVTGFGEAVRPERVDMDLHRRFVAMRVHQLGGENSPLLPLFCGPRQDRVSRFVRGLWGA
ncbi:MAG: hypothetical protein H6741_04290 [Alphaproteobacteria bacterium]|nr:hypothetical protein [Alphaproteobacteria bacterium]